MSKGDLYVFMNLAEFDAMSGNRIENLRDELYQVSYSLKADHPNYGKISQTLEEIMLKISRIKLDMDDVSKKLEP